MVWTGMEERLVSISVRGVVVMYGCSERSHEVS